MGEPIKELPERHQGSRTAAFNLKIAVFLPEPVESKTRTSRKKRKEQGADVKPNGILMLSLSRSYC